MCPSGESSLVSAKPRLMCVFFPIKTTQNRNHHARAKAVAAIRKHDALPLLQKKMICKSASMHAGITPVVAPMIRSVRGSLHPACTRPHTKGRPA
jgi:hypothetical protein